uniref:Ig-like domain-containing protein n=1 Tax=Callorhinchus milii TaxID=7868 RepID=A0A4W3IEN3_CALMI
ENRAPKSGGVEVSVPEGQTATLSCTYSADFSNVFMYWYRQYPGERFPNERDWKPIPREGRFVVKTDKKSWSSSLEINNLQVEDSADYYCKARYCWNGSGSKVTVTKCE